MREGEEEVVVRPFGVMVEKSECQGIVGVCRRRLLPFAWFVLADSEEREKHKSVTVHQNVLILKMTSVE